MASLSEVSEVSDNSDEFEGSDDWIDDPEDDGDNYAINDDLMEDDGGHELRRNKSFEVLSAEGVCTGWPSCF